MFLECSWWASERDQFLVPVLEQVDSSLESEESKMGTVAERADLRWGREGFCRVVGLLGGRPGNIAYAEGWGFQVPARGPLPRNDHATGFIPGGESDSDSESDESWNPSQLSSDEDSTSSWERAGCLLVSDFLLTVQGRRAQSLQILRESHSSSNAVSGHSEGSLFSPDQGTNV